MGAHSFALSPAQFDNINPVFTVFETLELAARLRSQQSEGELKAVVEDLLATVGLLDVKDVRVAKLAGGQLKLVSIAIGLVSRPKVLFLDEPTTGLDSTAAEAVVSAVKDIASTGKIVYVHLGLDSGHLFMRSARRLAVHTLSGAPCLRVVFICMLIDALCPMLCPNDVIRIMTLHQPSIMVFDHIDDLMLLSDGKLAYFGSVEDAPPCFAEMGCMLKLEVRRAPNVQSVTPLPFVRPSSPHTPSAPSAPSSFRSGWAMAARAAN